MRLSEGLWVEYQPPSDHPAARSFQHLRALSVSRDYRNQKEKLDDIHKQEGVEIFVSHS